MNQMQSENISENPSEPQKLKKRYIIGVIALIVFILFIIFRIAILSGVYGFVAKQAYENPQSGWYSLLSSSFFQTLTAPAYQESNSTTRYEIKQQERTEYKVTTKIQRESNIFPEGYVTEINGEPPSISYNDTIIQKINAGNTEQKIINSKQVSSSEGSAAIVITGKGSKEEIISMLQEDYRLMIENQGKSRALISFSDTSILNQLQSYTGTAPTQIYAIDFFIEDSNTDQVGTVFILYEVCNTYIRLPLIINQNQQYIIGDSQHIIDNYCSDPSDQDASPAEAGIVELSTCADCTYFPIGKKQKLRADYAPKVVSLSSLDSNYQIHEDTLPDLERLINDAKSAGFNIQITSAYRSYQDQVETFTYWVEREMNLYGYSRVDAEKSANKFSARPGFSEHQLGTVVDLNSIDCNAFDGYCYANEVLWKWLKENAYKYGFIQSYPDGKELITGYIPEAWHYRWIGIGNAGEYKKVEEKLVLQEWLTTKNGVL